jgi:hypothetical protein
MGCEDTDAPPNAHAPSASWNATFAGTSFRCTGNSGGEKYLATRRSSGVTGDRGPQMCSSVVSDQIGANVPSPSR